MSIANESPSGFLSLQHDCCWSHICRSPDQKVKNKKEAKERITVGRKGKGLGASGVK